MSTMPICNIICKEIPSASNIFFWEECAGSIYTLDSSFKLLDNLVLNFIQFLWNISLSVLPSWLSKCRDSDLNHGIRFWAKYYCILYMNWQHIYGHIIDNCDLFTTKCKLNFTILKIFDGAVSITDAIYHWMRCKNNH